MDSSRGLKAAPGYADASRQDIMKAVREYWSTHVHDLEIARHPVGSREFFQELEDYRFEKLEYLPRVVDFAGYRGRRLLEVGCGVGTDLVRFARGGAIVTGVDLAETSIQLARRNFELHGLSADLWVMDGERLEFGDGEFDVVYAHGVLQYTPDTPRMLDEVHRVLRPGGEAILMVYNRYSWLYLLSRLFGTRLEHQDAPVFKTFTIRQFRQVLRRFARVHVTVERFPVRTRLHHGLKAALYNGIFVGGFNLVPRPLVRPLGWHILARAKK